MKKIFGILMLVMVLSGCASMNWWGDWGNSVTVSKGDTLYSISRRYNVPIKDLISANRLSAPYTLYVGQKIKLPAKQYHTVQKGESLYGIARMYNVDITTLSRVNHLQTPYSLSVGQRLLLPASVSASAAPVRAQSANSGATKSSGSESPWSQSKSSPQTASASKKYTPAAAPTPVKARNSKFIWPVQGTVISGFGNLGSGRKNDGINIKSPLGTTVKAADSGTVAYAGNELKGFGNLILIKHSDGWITAYAHNDKLLVKKGQKVVRGEKIATVGSSGSVTTPQLHFEVRAGKKAVNPRSYLP